MGSKNAMVKADSDHIRFVSNLPLENKLSQFFFKNRQLVRAEERRLLWRSVFTVNVKVGLALKLENQPPLFIESDRALVAAARQLTSRN